jgi:hypothetical protein
MVGPGRAAHAPLSRLRSVLVELVVVLGGITAYFGIRGLTHEDPQAAIEHAHDIVRLEQALGLDLEQALQVWVLDADPVVTVANWVYIWGTGRSSPRRSSTSRCTTARSTCGCATP